MELPLLILDLDETLVFARSLAVGRSWDFRATEYVVTKRPYLDQFLDTVFGWFRVAVWTSSGVEYAREVVQEVFVEPSRLAFLWTSARCTRRYDRESQQFYDIKNLTKVRRAGYRLEQVLIIDDSPEKLERNYGNHLWLRPFEGNSSDRELLDVLPYLDWIRYQSNFRKIEKRTWRSQQTASDGLSGFAPGAAE